VSDAPILKNQKKFRRLQTRQLPMVIYD